MTRTATGIVTSPDAHHHNNTLTAQGYTIRHVETYLDLDETVIHWDAPAITTADCPF